MDYWVKGRIVAIIPARVQPFLRAQSWARFEEDLTAMCERWGSEWSAPRTLGLPGINPEALTAKAVGGFLCLEIFDGTEVRC